MSINGIIDRKGIQITDEAEEELGRFIESNCSYYYMINFLRITDGDVSKAISLYFFDEKIRSIILKYILRLEVQMKKDFIDCVYTATEDACFWSNPEYFNSKFTSAQRKNPESLFDVVVKDVKSRMKSMHYSSSGDKNHQAFYAMPFGMFIKFYSGMHLRYHYDFSMKYSDDEQNMMEPLKNYFNSIRVIRNRCCHSNHMISVKLKNDPHFRLHVLKGFVGDPYNEFEKTLYFIYSRLDNKDSFMGELVGILEEYEDCWKPYCKRHILPKSILSDLAGWR